MRLVALVPNSLMSFEQNQKNDNPDQQHRDGGYLLVNLDEEPNARYTAHKPDKPPECQLIISALGGFFGLAELLLTLVEGSFGHT